MNTIILAAGKGTRMKSGTPKVLHPVCGRPLLRYVLDVVQSVGSLKICVVIGHQGEHVRRFLGKGILTVVQRRLLGTADAVRCAQKILRSSSGDVLILCGDTPLLKKETVRSLVRKFRRTKADGIVLTAEVGDPSGYGRIVRDWQGRMTAIREEKDATEEERRIREINVGVYCFKARALSAALKKVKLNPVKKEYYLTDVIGVLSRRGAKIETYLTGEPQEGWGVNSREDLAAAQQVLRQRFLRYWMAEGVTIEDPQTTFVEADVRIGRDTVIRPFTVIEGNVRIGSRCVIGPFTHLRPGTRLADEVQIGNFAEVSRSRLGTKTLMKHFSFAGDAEIGRHVNIGAGTVTANYDGKNKNKTVIKDNAFIGSDSILVAPVKVGRGAMTGAGCVVKKGQVVPDGGVIVGVPGRIIKKI
ncbi:MAG: NTP transferase domain-containing protein [Candidatus Omnitrophota bacterium]|nr:NTP transferase domain-containing protein [Candidatus Omnitrophota bacterium]MDZ4242410.1 NTP transferase domain-containing protein [Candidatus Omnitrophota bacterium]